MQPANATDVANLAGVSQSTVSRVFSPGAKVSPTTRQKVLSAAEKLGYAPNRLARGLITQSSGIVGIVMADISNPFYPDVLERFTQQLQALGRQVLLFNAAPNQTVDDILPLVLQYQVEALIITSATLSTEMAAVCAKRNTPVILFNRVVPCQPVNSVCCDNRAGGALVARLLLEAGYERLAYIAGKANTSTNNERESGFGETVTEAGLTWQRAQGAYTYESGYEAARHLLTQSPRPEAIFCANDLMAMGALDAARSTLGLRVPAEVAIVGFDDIPAAAWSAYSLTTVRQPVNQMIAATLDLLTNPPPQPTSRLIEGRLVGRGSAVLRG